MQSFKSVTDDDLLQELSQLVKQGRGVDADVVARIGEVELRRLYAREACSSMFEYCRRVLLLRENEAYLRITVARAAREFPELLTMLRDGRLHLSGIARLAPHLTRQNADAILKRASGMSHREIRELVSELEPRADVAPTIRKLPRRPAPVGVAPLQLGAPRVESDTLNSETKAPRTSRPPVVEPLAPARYQVRFTADAELREKLERLQALMRSIVPDGDLARVIDIAVTEKLERVEARRFAKTRTPRKDLTGTDTTPSSRHIPAAVRRVVHRRDGGRCAYRDKNGRRCAKCHDLEFHHRKPFARGGDHSPSNLTLMCRAHNTLLAEEDYGQDVMARFRASAGRSTVPVDAYGAPINVRPRWRFPG
jgi:5-methylcytosine-specific restriction endonuclease McrA